MNFFWEKIFGKLSVFAHGNFTLLAIIFSNCRLGAARPTWGAKMQSGTFFWYQIIDRFRFRMYFSSFYRPMLLKEGASKMYLLNFWSFLKSLLQRSFKISLLLFADLIEAAFSFYNKWCKNFKGTQNSYSLQIYSLLIY